MVMSRDQNAGRSHSIKTDSGFFVRVEEFKHLRTTLTNENSVQEEIKSRLKSGNVCYHLVQNIFPSSLLPKNVKIYMYRTIILPVVLYGCETWSLTWREERRLRLFEKRVLRRICGPKRDDGTGELNDLYSSSNIVRVQIEKNEMGRACSTYGGEKSRIQCFGRAT